MKMARQNPCMENKVGADGASQKTYLIHYIELDSIKHFLKCRKGFYLNTVLILFWNSFDEINYSDFHSSKICIIFIYKMFFLSVARLMFSNYDLTCFRFKTGFHTTIVSLILLGHYQCLFANFMLQSCDQCELFSVMSSYTEKALGAT